MSEEGPVEAAERTDDNPADAAVVEGEPTTITPEAPRRTPDEIARRQLLWGKTEHRSWPRLRNGAISVPGIGFVVAPLFRDAPRASGARWGRSRISRWGRR